MTDEGKKRKIDRRRDPAQTREALIRSAQVLFNNPGYFHTDSNQIARHAGFAPGTFYQHFKNKSELFLIIQDQWHQQLHEIVRKAIENYTDEETLADYLCENLTKHFEDWAGLRNSFRALAATDESVRIFRLKKLEEVLEGNNILRKKINKPLMTRVEALIRFNKFERTIDSLIEGDFQAFGVDRNTALEMLKNIIKQINGTIAT